MGKCFLNWNVFLMLLKVYFIRKKEQELTQNVRCECKLVKYIISQTWWKNNGRQFNCLPKIMFFKENNSKGWPYSHLYTCTHLHKMIHFLNDWGTIIFSEKTVFLLRSSVKEIQFHIQKNRIKKNGRMQNNNNNIFLSCGWEPLTNEGHWKAEPNIICY